MFFIPFGDPGVRPGRPGTHLGLGTRKTTKNSDFIADFDTQLGGLGLLFSDFSVMLFPMLSGVVPGVLFYLFGSIIGEILGTFSSLLSGLWN